MNRSAETMRNVREFIRQPFAWPGGYPKILVMADGETICRDCARQEYRQLSNSTRDHLRDGWQVAGVSIYWEGAPVTCAHCGKETESAYGEAE